MFACQLRAKSRSGKRSVSKYVGTILFVGVVVGTTGTVMAQTESVSSSVPEIRIRERGALIPPDLPARIQARASVATVSGVLARAVPRRPVSRPECVPTQARFDWRAFGKVTDAKDQGACGSCWVFGAVAAMESSYLIENGLKIPTLPEGASEQEGLDCSERYTCNGGWHDDVLARFVKPGGHSRTEYSPYVGRKEQCRSKTPWQYSALHWEFVDKGGAPSATAMKQAICDRGPIVAAVNSEGWDKTQGTSFFRYSKFNPNYHSEFPNGVFKGPPSRSDLTASNVVQGDIDHVVTIVGWDNDKGAWIIKNSWGKRWGEDGFMYLAFGTSNLGFNAAWVQAQQILTPGSSPELLGAIDRLKSLNAVLSLPPAIDLQ